MSNLHMFKVLSTMFLTDQREDPGPLEILLKSNGLESFLKIQDVREPNKNELEIKVRSSTITVSLTRTSTCSNTRNLKSDLFNYHKNTRRKSCIVYSDRTD